MNTEGRPLSPHLSIYRWPITMTLSILHRVTGVALSVGLIAFVAWLSAIAFDVPSYATIESLRDSFLGQLCLAGWLAAFFFHLSNGIRHLFWDAGLGFEQSQATASAWAVIVATLLLTAGYWWLVTVGGGGA